MSKPLVVSIPHNLGKAEAVRRLKSGLDGVKANFGHLFTLQEETWTEDHLQFRVSALGQVASGTIDVTNDHVRLEVALPWLLAKIAETLQPLIRREGTLMLEKKERAAASRPAGPSPASRSGAALGLCDDLERQNFHAAAGGLLRLFGIAREQAARGLKPYDAREKRVSSFDI